VRPNDIAMKTQAQQLTRLDTSSVWAEDNVVKAPKKELPGFKIVAVIVTVALLAAAGYSGWLYLQGTKTLQSLTSQAGSGAAADAVRQTKGWAMKMAIAAKPY